MPTESWRAAVTRWGDPVFMLALLLTNHRAAAETAAINTFARVLPSAHAPDLETALATALVAQRRTWRRSWRSRGKQGALPREIAHIAPLDRLLLGLWLLRNMDGAHIVTIVRRSPYEVVVRLTAIIERLVPSAPTTEDSGRHIDLTRWIELRLGIASQAHDHLLTCEQCRATDAAWQQAIDTLRDTLRGIAKHQRLSLAAIDAIETAMLDAHEPTPEVWWQQRRIWLPALLCAVGVLLAILIVPWGGTAAPTAAPLTPEALVQQTIDAWTTPPVTGTLHLQVRALDARAPSNAPVVTDVWLAGADSAQHRVEVRDGSQLVEWQVADGSDRFDYAANPGYSSCEWNIAPQSTSDMLDSGALNFRISPQQQRAARDARLINGAFGQGYTALQRALTARDLRSFGTRIEGETTVVVLGYTDERVVPSQQIVLLIDPETHQLHMVQQVATEGGQTQTRDLWRLQARDEPENGVPLDLPRWDAANVHDRLFDPACPALKADSVSSLRSLLGLRWQQWFLPRGLPQGTTNAAVLNFNLWPEPPASSNMRFGPSPNVVYVGPGRWLSVSSFEWRPQDSKPRSLELENERWRIGLDPQPGGAWYGLLRPANAELNRGGFAILIAASGWSKGELTEELNRLITTLAPLDLDALNALNDRFLDTKPLPAALADVVGRAQEALQVPRGSTFFGITTTTVRPGPPSTPLADPYQLAAGLRQPEALNREQWLVYNESGIARFRNLRTLPDATIYEALLSDGDRFKWFAGSTGIVYTGSSQFLALYMNPVPLDAEMLVTLLRSTEPISITGRPDALILEQTDAQVFERFSLDVDVSGPVPPLQPYVADLPTGRIVRQIWLNRSTYLPQQLVTLHRDTEGRDTVLSTTSLLKRSIFPAPPANWTELPPLPDDALTIDVENDAPTLLTPVDSDWHAQTFEWRATPGITLQRDEPPAAPAEHAALDTIQQSRWSRFTQYPSYLWRQTWYWLGSDMHVITLTQGPRTIMRHILRYSAVGPNDPWTHSERIPVTIAGQQRDAWLLQDHATAALIVEVGDVLLDFTGDPDDLRGPLIEQLPKLQQATLKRLAPDVPTPRSSDRAPTQP